MSINHILGSFLVFQKDFGHKDKIADSYKALKDAASYGHSFDTILLFTQEAAAEMQDVHDYYTDLHNGFFNYKQTKLSTGMIFR